MTCCIIMNSPGGDPHVAYKIVKLLKNTFKTVVGFIPLNANSAATLISLCFDTIYFSSLGEMSPLDVQITKKSDDDKPKQQSALDHNAAIEEIVQLGLSSHEKMYKKLPEYLKEASKRSLSNSFALGVISPLLNQINPIELGDVSRSNKIAIEYGKKILTQYKKWKDDEAKDFMKKLVTNYPSHSNIIDSAELKKLGFQDTEELESNKKIDLQIYWILQYTEYFSVKYINITTENKKKKEKNNEQK